MEKNESNLEELQRGDYQTIANMTGRSLEVVRKYLTAYADRDTDTKKEIHSAAKRLISNRKKLILQSKEAA